MGVNLKWEGSHACPFLSLPCLSQGSICNLKSFQISIHFLKHWSHQSQRSTQMHTEGLRGFPSAVALTRLCAVCTNNTRSQQSWLIGHQVYFVQHDTLSLSLSLPNIFVHKPCFLSYVNPSGNGEGQITYLWAPWWLCVPLQNMILPRSGQLWSSFNVSWCSVLYLEFRSFCTVLRMML